MSGSLDELELFVGQLIGMQRHGGRLQRVGDTQLVLRDCLRWSHDFTEAVHARFPDMLIDVRGSRGNSLSGFLVVFTRTEEAARARGAWLMVIALALTGCAYALVASPWWVGAYGALRGI
jgi:hypothetical protein